MNNKKLSLFILISFIPVFLQLFVQPYGSRFVLISYLLLVYVIISNKLSLINTQLDLKKIILTLLAFIPILLYQMVIYEGSLKIYFKMLLPFFITVTMILLIKEDLSENIKKYIFILVFFTFILQLVLSFYESLKGSFLITEYNVFLNAYSYKMQDSYFNRFIIPWPQQFNPFNYLKIGLSGLYGQHNLWALQLPFYNLIFWFAFIDTKEKKYLIAIILVFISQVLNTTRTSIFAILITDLILYNIYFVKKNIISYMMRLVAILIALYITPYIYDFLASYFARVDTYTIRYDLYYSSIDYILRNFESLLFGLGYLEASRLAIYFLSLQNYNVELRSFENGLFDIIFLFGLIGFFLFIYLLKIFLRFGNDKKSKIFILCIILNIIILGFTLSHIFQLHVLPYVILVILLLNKLKNQNK